MERPNDDLIHTFMTITGSSETFALQKLQEHGGDLNEAINTHFIEGDRNDIHESSIAPQSDFMDIDEPIIDEYRGLPFPFVSPARNLNPFSLLDSSFPNSFLGNSPVFSSHPPFVSHPREVRTIPIKVNDVDIQSTHSGFSPTIEDITGSADAHGPEIHGTVVIDNSSDEDNPINLTERGTGMNERKYDSSGDNSHGQRPRSTITPVFDDFPDYGSDIEAEMIQAAIEASKLEVQSDYHESNIGSYNDLTAESSHQTKSLFDDSDLAEQENTLCEQEVNVQHTQPSEIEMLGKSTTLNRRLEAKSPTIQDETKSIKNQPLTTQKSEPEVGNVLVSPSSSPRWNDISNHSQNNGNAFPSDEWGGISSEEHDEAVMLEAAMFGGIPERTSYGIPYAPHQYMRSSLDSTLGSYPHQPRPPSPSLEAQRLIRDQQDDEYLASLHADQEKELKDQAAKEAALEEQRLEEEKSRKKLVEDAKFERQIATKEASLPQEPLSNNENAINLLVRMPDGSRRGRRFLKSDKLQLLFDFIDVGRGIKPGTYRLVRPYPRQVFTDGENAVTLNELGLTSKQEAFFLELI